MKRLAENMIQRFALNDGSHPSCYVISCHYKQFIPSQTIQISKVIPIDDIDNLIEFRDDYAVIPYKYIYEEIDQYDCVVYARYMGEDNIKRNFAWGL